MNEIGIKRVGNWFGTVLEIVLNRGTKAPRSADKSALEKTVSCRARASALAARGLLPWPREGFCPGRARASALAARGLLPWRPHSKTRPIVRVYSGDLAGTPVPACRNSCSGSNHCRNDIFFDPMFFRIKKHLGGKMK